MEHPVLRRWRDACVQAERREKTGDTRPRNFLFPSQSLVTSASKGELFLGSGYDVYRSILPTIETADQEIILVTCFWARSSTLDQLNTSLRKLSSKAVLNHGKIKVRICLSSLSLIQKLFHTRSPDGHVWQPSTWSKRFGLPSEHEIPGLDLEIKSIFVLPFSVMHPKFIVIDRKTVFLPSCNVSWERWFEGCIELSGPVVEQFVRFWSHFWASPKDRRLHENTTTEADEVRHTCYAVFLPSPYHALSIFDSVNEPTSPRTPLNLFIISSLEQAQHNAYLQTPNLTSKVVLNAIISALKRGIDIQIVTSERLMIMEQLITARTTTSRCVNWLMKKHRMMQRKVSKRSQNAVLESALISNTGSLSISFYQPHAGKEDADPVQTHLKLMIIDDQIVVLGSGNLDRASWVTSQELGLALFDQEFASQVKQKVMMNLEGRLKPVNQHY